MINKNRKYYCERILKRIEENKKRARDIYNQEHFQRVDEGNDDIAQYDLYRYFGTVFPDSPFGQIIKK